MSGAKLHAELLRQMRTPKHDGFNPLPPRSSRSWMDIGDAEEIRIYAWVLWRTIDLDPEATGGFRKVLRTYFAEDERGTLGVKHIAADLNMKSSNVSAALKRLVEKGRIWIEDGRICLNGNAPDPKLKLASEDKAKPRNFDICTDIKNQTLREYFQQLNEKERSQRVPEYLKVQKFKEEIEADAIAAARAAGQKYEEEYLASIGYPTPAKPKGRPRKERPKPAVQLTLLKPPPISVQISNGHFVQKEKDVVYEAETGSAQIPPSLVGSSTLSPSSELASNPPVENENERALAFDVRRACGRLPRLEGLPLSDATVQNMVQSLLQLRTAGDVRHTVEALNKACYVIWKNHQTEIEETGNVESYGWGYLVRVVQSEVEKRVGMPDIGEQIRAAAGKTMTKAQKAGGR